MALQRIIDAAAHDALHASLQGEYIKQADGSYMLDCPDLTAALDSITRLEKTNGQLKAEKQTLAERNAALTTQAGADGAEHLKLLAGYEGDLKAARDESAALRGLAMSKQLEEALAHFPERLHSLIKPQIAGMLDLVKAEDGSYAVQMKTGTDGAGVAFDGKEFGLHLANDATLGSLMQSRAVGPTGATRETIKSTTDHQHSGALDNRSIALGAIQAMDANGY
ncbi:hypothetical protein ACWY7G_004546 [Enterobacter hormaechei]|uniref:hypothetical protein n=1 Tax=Enterobacter cloacae complex TaxID=354276 RepID=UPI0021BA5B66|nr:hypothetical protein [Enterobacter hormaechei]EJK8935821.1 hypothetical protein [Enterobacter hormaechei]EJK8939207.1 hypothetical protein [Enterobacter hormaechei]EKS6613027.1 hypothetical protein [Enterobacter hormaechei]EKU3255313.1 hypothetical protein [Enterobacter hormaechei]EKV5716101.1 hypothetical protein [Enterobacter hormaechei]